MNTYDDQNRINALLREIASLPKGRISYKSIKGRRQPYLQWTENGRRYSRYIKKEGRREILTAVRRREELEEELKQLLSRQPAADAVQSPVGKYAVSPAFETRVMIGDLLQKFYRQVSGFQCREDMKILNAYLHAKTPGRICLLYGLRRTGKTTILLQAIADLPADRTAYIRIMTSDTFAALERDMRKLADLGFQYIFIDEVTLLQDFIDSSSLFSDIYAMMGMKIVLSGTDSLGFLLSVNDELYDRAFTIHTTFIPFREYSRLLNIHDIDEYIRYGGTFRLGETDFDDPQLKEESVAFRDDESTRRYIDTAIAHNIQHSLAHYRQGSHFRHLIDLYDAGELTSAINRVIEDMNHRFLLSVLTKDFISNDLGISRRNIRRDPNLHNDILDHINEEEVTDRLRHILDIRNRNEMTIALTNDHITEIKEYLYLLDLIVDCPIETIHGEEPVEHILFTQPGMRFSQARALVHALLKDSLFAAMDAAERETVSERILQEVRGRMLEEIILLETYKTADKTREVFKLQFPIGEFDMVIHDKAANTCELYEIKHSSETASRQTRFLNDSKLCQETEHRWGTITQKTVLYRGENKTIQDIHYLNAEAYLEAL